MTDQEAIYLITGIGIGMIFWHLILLSYASRKFNKENKHLY